MTINRPTAIPRARCRLGATALLFCLLAMTGVPPRARADPASAGATRELTVVVVDSLVRGPGRIPDFDRINTVFTNVFERRKWPVRIKVERFASNSAPSDIELQVFYQGIRRDTPDSLAFQAWMTLYDHGVKHDFGVIRYRYNPRPLQDEEDVLERVVRGAAEMAASRIEAVLFPKAEGPRH